MNRLFILDYSIYPFYSLYSFYSFYLFYSNATKHRSCNVLPYGVSLRLPVALTIRFVS
ncbi:hypothetical protein [Faecalitalea cylindroides]|uniref:Uncharacterized protein n=1 Tax=Faecalitalea cylindroides TaxID=39483 RepID=A0AAW6FS96_9FIRM|nr:hypothetical protein [Faecalitalea cylindroides]MDC0828345.1 hypothetical protein [Faecalitalea cylindroides]